MEIKTGFSNIVIRFILIILIGICIFYIKINPGLFGFLSFALLLMLLVNPHRILRITDTDVEFEYKRIIPFTSTKKTIKLSDIKSVEYRKKRKSILVLVLSTAIGRYPVYSIDANIVITLNDDTVIGKTRTGSVKQFEEAIEMIKQKSGIGREHK